MKKTSHTDWEKIFANHIVYKRCVHRTHGELFQLNNTKRKKFKKKKLWKMIRIDTLTKKTFKCLVSSWKDAQH